MHQTRWLRTLFALLCCVFILSSAVLPAAAREATLEVTFLKITEEGFVADTLNGVEARYNRYGATLYCTELVERYYKEVYGLTVQCAGSGVPKVKGNDQFWFEETETPKTGDVMFAPAAARGTGYNHWALVKAYDQTTKIVTCFEQNWRWNGQAGVDRQIPYPSCYRYYTLKCSDPALLAALRPQDAVSSWAEESVAKAASYGLTQMSGGYQEAVSREDFCQIALKVLEAGGAEVDWTQDICQEAFRQGLLASEDGEDASLTREQAAVIAVRLLEKTGLLPEAAEEVLTVYQDAASISAWARSAVAQMTATGLMGKTGAGFAPQQELTLEQAIVLLVRLYEAPAPTLTLNAAEYLAAPETQEPVPEQSAASAVSRLVAETREKLLPVRAALQTQSR